MKSFAVLFAACPIALTGAVRAQVHQCPDVRASQVDAREEVSSHSTRCGLGFSLFGFDISIGGPRCPDYKFLYPSHQECLGVHNEGTACVFSANLDVSRERCQCTRYTILSTGVTLPQCECHHEGSAGTIEDFQTVNCTPGPGA